VKDSIKATRLLIDNPNLSREKLQIKIGAPPNEKLDCYTVKFDKVTLTNRCPDKLVDNIQASIRAEFIHRWQFNRKGGKLYKPPLHKFAKDFGFAQIVIDKSTVPKWIEIVSKVKQYRDHDKKVKAFATYLQDKGIIAYPSSCIESAVCPVPSRSDFLSALKVVSAG